MKRLIYPLAIGVIMVGLGSCINENSLSESKQQANSNNYTIPINDAIKQ